jgi:transcriptional regulator with XRE-family HTH domain
MREIMIDQIVSAVGNKIKKLRQDQGLSLSQIAERAGVSVTTVHKLERSEMTPTITVLMKIADAFGERAGFFLGEENNTGFEFTQGAEYTPKGGGKKFREASGNTRIDYLAFRLNDGKLLVLLTFLKAGTMSGPKPQSHPGEEFIFCLAGEIRYEVERKTYLLKKGDSLHFHAHLPHRWEVTGKKGTKNLWIITPPPTGGVTELWK